MTLEEHNILAGNLAASLRPQGETELIQTHISTIILCGDIVYKLKKPVDFGFLDYSTLEKRHRNCLEEQRINERYAPGLYLGVVAVTGTIEHPKIGGEGSVLEYAVKMRRFDQRDQLDHMAERGEIDRDMVEKVAALIAGIHIEAERVDPASEYGSPEKVLAPMQENFVSIDSSAIEKEVKEKAAAVKMWTLRRFDALGGLLEKRKRDAFIRECHGDLHLHNMACFEGEPILFDAIEFNPSLNHIDTISDLAFLLMDLEYRGLLRQGRRLLSLYLEKTGDYEGLGVLDFYKVYRAMVRAKVAILRTDQMPPSQERRAVVDEAHRYIDLALSYTESGSTFLAITHGYSGSGKSTVSMELVEWYGAVRIRSDVERMRLYGDRSEKERYAPDADKAIYERVAKLAATVLRSGYPAVADATFLKRWQRQLLEKVDTPRFKILDLQCDRAMMQERIEERAAARKDISEANSTVLAGQIESAEALAKEELQYRELIDCSSLEAARRSIEKIDLPAPNQSFVTLVTS